MYLGGSGGHFNIYLGGQGIMRRRENFYQRYMGISI